MARAERVRITDWHKAIRETARHLDRTNVKILSAMWKSGPRNLLKVSRRTGIPFTSVYHRVAKVEEKTNRIAALVPQVAGLGLVRLAVIVAANPGQEDKVTAALVLPKYCRSVNRCEGSFTHYSIHTIPFKHLKEFRKYVKRLEALKLASKSTLIEMGEYIPNFPDFRYYNPSNNEWTFQWPTWLKGLRKKPTATISDPSSYALVADKKDVLIVRELEKNARKSFAELSPILGISLQGVKYHYDKKLVASGIVKHFDFEVPPYPEDLSAHHEMLLNFKNSLDMNRFYSLIPQLFFVVGVSKLLHRNALLIRTYTPQSQVPSLFDFLSEMAREGTVESYHAIRQISVDQGVQTIPCELYIEEEGWSFDLRRYLSELSKLARATNIRGR